MSQVTRILSASFLLSLLVSLAPGQSNLTAKVNVQPQPAVDGSGSESDRARDGLLGPVRRVRTEVAKLSAVAGKTVEDSKHVVLETAEYDLKGAKTQNQYFPIEGATLTGRESYKYDEKGNISEMTLAGADGSLVSKEVYKYDYDSVGNWVKMTTSVAVVGNGKIEFEQTEATYRTIFYYLDAAMTKMMESASLPPTPSAPAKVDSSNQATGSRVSNVVSPRPEEKKLAAALPPTTSVVDKTHLPTAQPTLTDIAGARTCATKSEHAQRFPFVSNELVQFLDILF